MTKTIVSAVRCDRYELEQLKESISEVLAPLGGLSRYVRPGKKVLLKVNCLTDARAEKAVTTNPVFLNAVIDLVKECGAEVLVGDSPAIKPLSMVLKKSGMHDVLTKTGVHAVAFKNSKAVLPHKSDTFHYMEIAGEIDDFDLVINLPKLKTHIQMQLTLAIKNMFGCIVGARKSQWHLKCGVDRKAFATMLADNYRHISPALTILDGIVGMDGNGPVNGRIRHFDVIMASTDGVAIDSVISHLAGFDKDEYLVLNAAREKGVGQADLGKIDFIGGRLEEFIFQNFQKAEAKELETVPIPFISARVMKSYFTPRPKQNISNCVLCLECAKICPPKVIKQKGKRLEFNYDDCIRCFCCHEICQHNGIEIYKGLIYRVFSAFGKKT